MCVSRSSFNPDCPTAKCSNRFGDVAGDLDGVFGAPQPGGRRFRPGWRHLGYRTPDLVTRTGTPVRRTSSRTARQVALNLEIAISRMFNLYHSLETMVRNVTAPARSRLKCGWRLGHPAPVALDMRLLIIHIMTSRVIWVGSHSSLPGAGGRSFRQGDSDARPPRRIRTCAATNSGDRANRPRIEHGGAAFHRERSGPADTGFRTTIRAANWRVGDGKAEWVFNQAAVSTPRRPGRRRP